MNLLYTFHTINFNTGGLLIDVVSYMRGGGGRSVEQVGIMDSIVHMRRERDDSNFSVRRLLRRTGCR